MSVIVSANAWGAVKRKGRYARAEVEKRMIGDIEFGSIIERRRAEELLWRERRGEISDLTWHPAFEVYIAGQKFCTYTADSSYSENGKLVIEEVKSAQTRKDPSYRLRRKAAELFHRIKVTEYVA